MKQPDKVSDFFWKESFGQKLEKHFTFIFGPILYLIIKVFRISGEYKKGDILKTVKDIGKPDTSKFLPRNTKVEFVKASEPDASLKAYVQVKTPERMLVLDEVDVKLPSWWRRKETEITFNYNMMRGNPRLKEYHPFLVNRVFYRVVFFVIDLPGKIASLFRRKDEDRSR